MEDKTGSAYREVATTSQRKSDIIEEFRLTWKYIKAGKNIRLQSERQMHYG